MTFELRRVEKMPTPLQEGVLYVSQRYSVAAHLCACGCGYKVVTPLGPVEWSVKVVNELPTLSPSIGNWQLPCRSHYLIIEGEVRWANDFSESQVIAGRKAEQERRVAYYSQMRGKSLLDRFMQWIQSILARILS